MYIDADTINNLAKLLCSMVVIGGETITITGISFSDLVIGWQGRYRGYFNR